MAEETTERKYTKDQLVKAMTIYYQEYKDQPEAFDKISDKPKEDALGTIEHLLNLVE